MNKRLTTLAAALLAAASIHGYAAAGGVLRLDESPIAWA